MVDRYAKYATEHLTVAAARIASKHPCKDENTAVTFCHARKTKRAPANWSPFNVLLNFW
jgi:hypothetical protein